MARIVVIAGEASGDRLGASFIESARRLYPDATFEGIAGPAMREAGCKAWFDCQDLAVMGLFEVLRHLPRLLRIKREVERRLLADPPDVLLGIDAPDFNLRIEKMARKAGIPTVHYVCPSVWAWRESRVKVLRKACDHILCLLPFEPAFLAGHGINGEFVGHPLADEISGDVDQAQVREQLGISSSKVLTLMPGSRSGEVQRVAPELIKTAAWLNERVTDFSVVVPVARVELRPEIEIQFQTLAPDVQVRFLDGQAHDAIAAGDAVLLVSGTAALEVMLLKRPMVVAYKLSAPSYYVARFLQAVGLFRAKYMSLPNLLADRPLVSEFLQAEVAAPAMGQELLSLLESGSHRDELVNEFIALGEQLRCSAGVRSAAAVLRVAGLKS